MADLEVLALDTATPQIRAPGAGDGYAVPRDMTFSPGTTLSVPNAQVTNVKANDGTAAIVIADSTGAVTVSTPTVVSVNSSSDALRITQVGAGNALVVEDSTNPDATPFVVDASGRVVIQKATAQTTTNTGTPVLQAHVVGGNQAGLYGWSSTSTVPAQLRLLRSASGTIGTLGAVSDGFDLGSVQFFGDDGSDFVLGAQILAEVDGTPGTNDMPGRLVFSTTADGASTPTERMRIDSKGHTGIGSTALTTASFRLGVPIEGGATAYGAFWGSVVQPAVTASANYHQTNAATSANGGTPYTVSALSHYTAAQGTFNADSTVTSQYGFQAVSTLTGATNNYGFYSNIASGTNRWNFFANGTAANYFAGNLLVGTTTSVGGVRLTSVGGGVQLSGGTTAQEGVRIQRATGYATFTGINNDNNAYNGLQFFTSASAAATIDTSGNVGIGGTADATTKLQLTGTLPTSGNVSRGILITGTVPSGSTAFGDMFVSLPSTAAAAFTCSNLRHFVAAQSTIGAGSAVTNQYGFSAESSLTGATNNYGFYSNIASGTNRFNFYANGTADNYFAGNVGIGVTPSFPLHIQNATGEIARMINSTGSERIHYYARSAASTSRIESQNSAFQLFTVDGFALSLGTANVERVHITSSGNVGFNTTSFGASSSGVIGILNAATVPTGNPTGGGVLYVEAGALKYRGSSGTVTTIANA